MCKTDYESFPASAYAVLRLVWNRSAFELIGFKTGQQKAYLTNTQVGKLGLDFIMLLLSKLVSLDCSFRGPFRLVWFPVLVRYTKP